MPFGPIPVIGAGAGAAAVVQDQQLQQQRQQDLMAQLYMHAQAMQAQRQQNDTYKMLGLASLNQSRESEAANRVAQRNQEALKMIPGGRMIPAGLAATPEAAEVSEPEPVTPEAPPPSLAAGGTGSGERQVQDPLEGTIANSPAPGMRRMVKIPTPEELNRQASLAETKSRDQATEAQRQLTNALSLRRISDTEGNAANKSDLDWQKLFFMMNKPQGPKPSFQEVDQVSNMNSAEIQGVKVLNFLHNSGLDKSNDPSDPRWNSFLAQDLKIRPADEGKADQIQRTAYVKAILARAIMGGRPNQYTMQMIEQHLPDQKMSGKQLYGVINDVLDEARTKRVNMQNFYGPDQAKQLEPSGGMTFQQWQAKIAGEQGKQGTGGDGFVVR